MRDDIGRTPAAGRLFGAVTAAVGTVTVMAAPRVGATAAADRHGVPDPRIVRVLGARQAVQGVVTVLRPDATVLALGSGVDLTHAASLLPVIALWARFRRPAAISAAMATTSALAGAALARRAR